MRLFHRAAHSDAILREGFRDGEDSYMTDTILKGVWLSNIPLDLNEGAGGNDLLLVDVPDTVVAEYEVVEEGQPYREFLIPAEILNKYPARALSNEEEAELDDPRFPFRADSID